MRRRRRLLAVLVTAALGILALTGCGAPATASAPSTTRDLHVVEVAGAGFVYCASRPVESLDESVKRVIVAVHGLDRNACGMRRAVLAALGGEPEGTLVVAPWFAAPDDGFAGHSWAPGTWPAGDVSSADVSSFAVLDDLVERFGDRDVTVVGFSGGGQFVNRYAATSPVTASRYVVMNPSTYLWFTARRPGPTASCRDANVWRYGLAGRADHPYVSDLSAETIRRRYASRTVVHLVGAADNDPTSGSLDRSCAAMAQGRTRLDRARNYAAHLAWMFGPAISQTHPVMIIADAAHDPVAVLGSEPGRRTLGIDRIDD